MKDNPEKTILVIDDEDAVRQSFIDYLEDMGYRVFTAENGRAGVDLFDREDVDLVTVDLRMPEMDGLEVLAHIRQKSPDTPAIVVSGTGIISDVVEAVRQGAWDYILKPVKDLHVLSHAVHMALEKARLKKENDQYQKRLEQMVAERTYELELANEHLRSILDTIWAGIIIVETETQNIVYANSASMTMLRIEPHMIPGLSYQDIVGPKVESYDYQSAIVGEKWMKTADGMQIPVLKSVTGIRYMGEDCWLESFIDLTDQKAAAEEKETLEAQLRQAQKMEALGTLAGGIAHDFNNMLGIVMGNAQLGLLDIQNPDNPLKKQLNDIYMAGNHAKELVRQILTFSRMQEQSLLPIRIDPIVKEALKLMKSSLPADIELKSRIDSRQQVMADATQIHQVIMNLCTNAYHAMEGNVGTLTVSLNSVFREDSSPFFPVDLPPGSYLRLSVEDTGTGIDPLVLENIFDPYFSTKDKDKGTGLGLSVVHGIVNAHGGMIDVTSKPGEGASFHIFLPVTEKVEEDATDHRAPLARGQEKVLLVDDEKSLVAISSQMLDFLGYDVTGVVGSTEALDVFKQAPHAFELVITDLNMPVMSGDRLAEEIRRIRPDIPIILCTGFADRINQNRMQKAGIRKFVIKPVTMDILAESIRGVLDKANAKRP